MTSRMQSEDSIPELNPLFLFLAMFRYFHSNQFSAVFNHKKIWCCLIQRRKGSDRVLVLLSKGTVHTIAVGLLLMLSSPFGDNDDDHGGPTVL